MAPSRRRSPRAFAGRVKRGLQRRLQRQEKDPDPQRTAWIDEAQVHVDERRYDDAARILDAALLARPDDVFVLSAQARLTGHRGDWEGAARQWRELADSRAEEMSAHGWIMAIHSHRRIGDLDRAAEITEVALTHFPFRKKVLREAANVAMARGEWDEAVLRWAKFWRFQRRDLPDDHGRLPMRAGIADWYDAAWHDVAHHLDSAQALTDRPHGPEFHVALADVLARAELPEDEMFVLERAAREHPEDLEVAYALASARLASGLTDVPLPITQAEVAEVFAALPPYTRPPGSGLGPIRLLRVPAHSSIELALRTGHYVDRLAVGRLVQEVSERDRWPEPISPTNVLLAQARAWADRYGAKYAAPPHLPAETLADALLANIHHESAVFVPMKRLAAELAARAGGAGGAPIVIEMPDLSPGYLGGYLHGSFDLAVLYLELLDLGCNAFLCHLEPEAPRRAPAVFQFLPKWRSIKALVEVVEDPAPHRRALVPAGIRRVGRLADRLDDLIVYESGSVVKDFAYDRSINQDFPVVAGARLHPQPDDLLPVFLFPLTRTGRINGHDLRGDKRRRTRAAIEIGEPIGGTWPQWLHRATSPLLEFIAQRAATDVAERGVVEANIGDHFFAESVIVGDAVRRAGGKVVLWPHSTNPVHVHQRRADSFDEVHAVTHTGSEIWRAAFPDKVVAHSPDSMLTPSPARSFDPAFPVSLVFFGGRSTLGDMPILDTKAHRELYRKLFAALAELRATHPVDVYFKPRGLTGEHEQWLFQTVGKTAAWKPVYQHPLRLELPNMVFASVSMGTSALIEGMARGIPGLIVREFAVRDYVTLSEDTFPIVPTEKAVDLLAGITTAEGYRQLIEGQLGDLRHELGL